MTLPQLPRLIYRALHDFEPHRLEAMLKQLAREQRQQSHLLVFVYEALAVVCVLLVVLAARQ